jgi:hypothetical protein
LSLNRLLTDPELIVVNDEGRRRPESLLRAPVVGGEAYSCLVA